MRRTRLHSLAAAVALVVLAVGVAVAGAQTERHQQGSNFVPLTLFSAIAKPGRAICQPGQTVPAGTGALRIRAGTFGAPGPRLSVSVTAPGAPALRGGLAAGWHQGDVVVPVATARRERLDARVCIGNDGPGRLAVAGGPRTAAAPARVGRASTAYPIRLEFLAARPQSWWSFASALADRLGTVRDAFPGGGALFAWGLLALAAVAGAVALVLREARR